LLRSLRRTPTQRQLAVRRGAIAKIKVYQVLIRNARLRGQSLEIQDDLLLESDCHLFLQTLHVWVRPCVAEIVYLSHLHRLTYGCISFVPAFLAEIILITLLSPRRQWTTTSTRFSELIPMITKRSSSLEWSGSGMTSALPS